MRQLAEAGENAVSSFGVRARRGRTLDGGRVLSEGRESRGGLVLDRVRSRIEQLKDALDEARLGNHNTLSAPASPTPPSRCESHLEASFPTGAPALLPNKLNHGQLHHLVQPRDRLVDLEEVLDGALGGDRLEHDEGVAEGGGIGFLRWRR